MTEQSLVRADLLVALEASGAITPTELRLADGLPMAKYEALGVMLGRLGSSVRWWQGDLLAYGERNFGTMAEQLAESFGMSPDLCLEVLRVALAFPPSRRRPGLSWSLHRTVAARWLDGSREELLDRAERERLNVREFEAVVRDLRELRAAVAAEHDGDDQGVEVVDDGDETATTARLHVEADALRFSDADRAALGEEVLRSLVATLLGEGFPVESATVTVEAGPYSFSVTFAAPTLAANGHLVLPEVRVA